MLLNDIILLTISKSFNILCTGHHPGGTFVYHIVQKINLFPFCQFSIPFTFDGACWLYRSQALVLFSGPKLAHQSEAIRLQYATTHGYYNVDNSTKLDLAWLKNTFRMFEPHFTSLVFFSQLGRVWLSYQCYCNHTWWRIATQYFHFGALTWDQRRRIRA